MENIKCNLFHTFSDNNIKLIPWRMKNIFMFVLKKIECDLKIDDIF